MKIHEYQAKAILARYGVTTPRGEVAFSKDEARAAAQRLRTPVVVVKSQIHAGGRGKAGGVKLAHSPDEAAEIASAMLGMNLVTVQTGPSGRIVKRVLIEEGLDIKRELYLSILVDRAAGKVLFMASTAGGMEIEEVAKTNPDAILREFIQPAIRPSALSGAQAHLRSRPHRRSRAASRLHFSRRSTKLSSTPTPRCSKSIPASSPATAASSRSTQK